jgi:hypothetical protein
MPAEHILANEDLRHLLEAQMVPIGSARNGDILVIRFPAEGQTEVGLVCHDQLWEEDARSEDAYVLVTPTVEEYLYRAAEERHLPIDSYAAHELQSLRGEIGSREPTVSE